VAKEQAKRLDVTPGEQPRSPQQLIVEDRTPTGDRGN
jgi:hypothetical protein